MKKRKSFLAFVLIIAMLLTGLLSSVNEAEADTGTEVEPVIGNYTNLAASNSALSGNVAVGHEKGGTYDFSGSVQGNTWYISTTLNFTGNLTASKDTGIIFATGTHKDDSIIGAPVRLDLVSDENNQTYTRFALRGGSSNRTTNNWEYGHELIESNGSLSSPLTSSENHRITIKVSNGNTVSCWINEVQIVKNYSLSKAGITDLKPCIGWRNYVGSTVNFSNIQLWDGITYPEYLIGNNVNLAESVEFPSKIDNYRIPEGQVNITGDTWYYSAIVNHSLAPGAWQCLEFAFAKATIDGTTDQILRMSTRPGNPEKGYYFMWYAGPNIYDYSNGNNLTSGQSGIVLEANKDYRFTVKVTNKDKVSFWIDDKLVLNEYSLSTAGKTVTNVEPVFGMRAGGTSGTITNVQVWDGVTVKPEYNENEDINWVNKTTWDMATDAEITENVSYGDGYCYSGTVVTTMTTNYGNVRIRVADAKVSDGTNTSNQKITVRIRPNGCIYIFSRNAAGNAEVVMKTFELDHVVFNRSNYKYTVFYKNGLITLYVNDTLMFKQVQLEGTSNGQTYSDITPATGVCQEGCTTATVSDMKLWADVTDVRSETHADISVYREAENYTAPKKVGYVFAGWYTDESFTIPFTGNIGSAYAKFVPEEVLSVKAQMSDGTTSESSNAAFRVLTSVDALEYSSIGFNITKKGIIYPVSDSSVYKRVIANTGGKILYADPTVFSPVSEWFHTLTIGNIPQRDFNEDFQVAAFWKTQDGTIVTGAQRTLSVNHGLAALNGN